MIWPDFKYGETKQMQITYSRLLEFHPDNPPRALTPLVKVLQAKYGTGAIPLSKVVFDIGKIKSQVEAAWKGYDEARAAIVQAFDTEDAEWRSDADKLAKFNSEFIALIETEIELNFKPLSIAVIDQAKDLELSVAEIEAIQWLFESEDKAE